MDGLYADLGLWIEGLGAFGYLAAALIMAVVAIFPFPAEAPAMLNGMLFGPFAGTLVSWSGSMLGGLISYEIARRLGRPAAVRILPASMMTRADQIAERATWGWLLGARLFPLVAFTALNWGCGLISVPRRRFFWTTALGIIPGAILFTMSGTGLALLFERYPRFGGWIVVIAVLAVMVWALRKRGVWGAGPDRRPPTTSP